MRLAYGFVLACAACGAATADARGPTVVAVHPTADAIPENVLRFYVTFSEPMREGEFLKHVRLERADAHEDLTGVFFDNIHELWSADRRRITLLVDPGRVKTGLRANRELGRAFESGRRYRLRVLDTWISTRRERLRGEFVHTFEALPEDREPVRPQQWCLHLPPPGSTTPVRVDFGEPVDHISLHQLLRVVDPDGTPLSGRWSLEPGDTEASWRPEVPWRSPVAAHRFRISGRFEDVAGNNLNAAFEHPPGGVGAREGKVYTRRFDASCKPAHRRDP